MLTLSPKYRLYSYMAPLGIPRTGKQASNKTAQISEHVPSNKIFCSNGLRNGPYGLRI